MKILRSVFVLVFVVSFFAAQAGVSSDNIIKPRFFYDKLYITTDESVTTEYSLFVFNESGNVLAEVNFVFTDGEYVLDAKGFDNGVYSYYIKQGDQLVAKGSFTKY